jgi:hypothetical protein
MRIMLPLILALPAFAGASDVWIQGNLAPRNMVPTFDHGYLAVYANGGIEVYAPDGTSAMRIDDTAGASVVNVDIDSDGTVALARRGHQTRTAAAAGGIAIFSPDGSPAGVIATGTYIPAHVCFAPDHSIWIVGDEDFKHGQPPDYFLLRHYSREGQLIGQYFPKSSFSPEARFTQVIVGGWKLRIADGRVGFSVEQEHGRSWVEADLTGKEIGRWTMPEASRPVAMTESGTVYAAGRELSVLDRSSGSWKPVPAPSGGLLLGAEGDTLVFEVRGTNQIHRVP